MIEFFDNFYNVLATIFSFIGNIIFTVLNAINSIIDIINSIFTLISRIVTILPDEFNSILVIFIPIYSSIMIYKIFRKG